MCLKKLEMPGQRATLMWAWLKVAALRSCSSTNYYKSHPSCETPASWSTMRWGCRQVHALSPLRHISLSSSAFILTNKWTETGYNLCAQWQASQSPNRILKGGGDSMRGSFWFLWTLKMYTQKCRTTSPGGLSYAKAPEPREAQKASLVSVHKLNSCIWHENLYRYSDMTPFESHLIRRFLKKLPILTELACLTKLTKLPGPNHYWPGIVYSSSFAAP